MGRPYNSDTIEKIEDAKSEAGMASAKGMLHGLQHNLAANALQRVHECESLVMPTRCGSVLSWEFVAFRARHM